MFILQAISTKVVSVFIRLFVLILILQLAVPVPALSQTDTTGLQDMSQGLDDFAPDQPEKPLNALVPDDSKPTQAAPAITTIAPKAPATTTVPKVVATVSAPSVPANWQHYSVAGLSVSVPPDWVVIRKRSDKLQIGNLDKATRKGVMLMIGTQRKNPLNEKKPKEMKITTLKNKELAGHIFAQEIMQADLPQAKMYAHMFFSKKPYIKTKYSDNFLVVTLGATNLDPTDYKEIFVTILNSIKAAAKTVPMEKPTQTQTAKNGFVTFTLPSNWKVVSNNKDFLSFSPKNTGAAYMTIGTGEYAHQDVTAKDDFATPPHISHITVLGQSATLYEGETTQPELVSNGAMYKGVKRLFVLDYCTADGGPIALVQVATRSWLTSTGFGALEKAIEMSLPKGAKSCTSDSESTQDKKLQIDIDKDGKLETVLWKKFSTTELGDFYQLMVLDDDGSLLWKGPEKADDTDPLVFYALDTGVSLPQILVDFDLDGNIELLAPMAQSDVSPTYYRKLRWRGDHFEPLLQSALMFDIDSKNRFVWKLAMGAGGTWVSKLSRTKRGEILAEITQMRDYGGVDMGEVSIVFDTKGAIVKRVLRPPAKVGGDTVTSPFEGSPSANSVVQVPVPKSNTYQAKISDRDHYNSRGVRLRNLASVLRQDRANYYKYGGDRRDQPDRYFSSIDNRNAMERIAINPVGISYRALKDLVVHGTPLLKIEIEQSRLNVRVIER